MNAHARVVIIGGGVMGVGLLYHLAREGWQDLVLVEKGELTSGSTWHAAGQCPTFTGSYNLAKIHHYSNTLYPQLEALTGQYVSWHGCGGIRLATTPGEVDWFRYVQGFANNIGFRMELVGPDEIRRINPFLDTTGVLLGAHTLDDGHVDPAGVTQAMATGARALGATIHRRTRVTDINARADGSWEVVTDRGSITAEIIVNAGGCYAREVGAMMGVQVPITNMEHQYLVTEAIGEFLSRDVEIPVMRDPYTAGYYRQEQKAGLVGIYESTHVREAWAARGGSPTWESENELFEGDLERIYPWLERALKRMPIFEQAGIKRIVNGAIPHTPDGNPLLGPAPGLRNAWMCCGSSIGIAQGAGCGKFLAQWMVHGQSEINMREFDPRRFGPWSTAEYTRAKSFQDYEHMFITHLPGEERPAGRPARATPLYQPLIDQGAVHTEACGWERPKWFSPDRADETPGFRHSNAFPAVAAECRAVRERVGIMDLSSFAKFDVTGPDAATLLDRLCANRLPRRAGGVVLTHMLTPDGFIESEVTITRLADDHYYVLSGASAELHDLDMLRHGVLAGEQVRIDNVSDAYGMLVLAGPRSREVLQALTSADLDNGAFRWMTAQQIEVAGVATRALRVSYVGELGWELHVPMSRLGDVYRALWAAGEPHGIANFGVYAVNCLRMEKAYRGWGAELTNEITLVEADMERFVALDKGAFVGRDATLASQQAGPRTRLVYLEVDTTDSDVRGGEPVYQGEACVGVTTSGGYGHAVGKGLAFAYVDPALTAPGTEFAVQLLGERHAARVLAEPAYDPASLRLRG